VRSRPSAVLLKDSSPSIPNVALIPTVREPTMKNSLPLVVTVAFSVVGVVGDYLLKLASEQRAPLRSGWFYLGFAVYASTAFGWVYVMRHLKLATIGAVYSVSMILLLTGVGVAAFRQPLNAYEVAGLAMAIGSLVLLMRFA
jgi:small multidrug resistance pump